MIGKGRNMFQANTMQEAESINNLLDFVPEKLEKMREEIIASIQAESQEVEEWNEESQRYEKSVWFPSYDFGFVDYMLDAFFSSMVLRIYSFAENGLKVLSEISKKPKQTKGQSGQKQPSDIDLYYQGIEKKQGITLPPIETLWPDKASFHALRKRITHHGQNQMTKQESDSLSTELETIMKMLLFVEEQIRVKNPGFNPKLNT